MARRSPPPTTPQRPIHSIEEKQRDIARIERRINELEAFDPQSVQRRFSDPAVKAMEARIDEALSVAFGHRTVEYNRYKDAATFDHGPVVMRVSPNFGGGYGHGEARDVSEARQYVAEGKEQSLTLLREAVRTLTEEIQDEEATQQPASLPRGADTRAAAVGDVFHSPWTRHASENRG